MHILMTFFWTFLLSEMIVYVVSSMNGEAFHFSTGLILGIIATILVLIVTALIPNDPIEKH